MGKLNDYLASILNVSPEMLEESIRLCKEMNRVTECCEKIIITYPEIHYSADKGYGEIVFFASIQNRGFSPERYTLPFFPEDEPKEMVGNEELLKIHAFSMDDFFGKECMR